MQPARFVTNTDNSPKLALRTTQIHGANLFSCEPSARCPETALKKSRKAASSRTAENGSSVRQCQRYTFAAQRVAAPTVHIVQHAQAAAKEVFTPSRSFGME